MTKTLTKEEMVKALIDDPRSKWSKDDETILNQFEDHVLDKLQLNGHYEEEDDEDKMASEKKKGNKKKKPIHNNKAPVVNDDPEDEDEDDEDEDDGEGVHNSLDALLNRLPADLAGSLREAVTIANETRDAMIEVILANEAHDFEQEDLKGMPLNTLKGIYSMARKAAKKTSKEERLNAQNINNSFAGGVGGGSSGSKQIKGVSLPTMDFLIPKKS